MAVAVAVSTVAVVVRQLVRGNAIAHLLGIAQAPQKKAGTTPLERGLTKLAVERAASDAWRAAAAVDLRKSGVGKLRCSSALIADA